MAKYNANEAQKLNYNAEIRALKEYGLKPLYYLWGEEDYLREQYLVNLKRMCLPEGENDFCYHRFDVSVDAKTVRRAMDALPFLAERSMVELRDVDINRLSDVDEWLNVIADVPDYCTLVFVQDVDFEPDGRTKFIKALKAASKEIKFTAQNVDDLTKWIAKRFHAEGKSIDLDAAQRLLFISGNIMSKLIPEIEKIAAYSKSDKITVADVDAVANRIPDVIVFDMTDLLAQKKYNAAMYMLNDLMANKENEPILIAAVLGAQMRKLYAARLAVDEGLGSKYVMKACKLKFEGLATKLMSTARGFTLPQLVRAVELCADADYRMKSTGLDGWEILKETVARIAAGETDVQR